MTRIALLAALSLSACSSLEDHGTVFVDEPVSEVFVQLDKGSVTLIASDDEAVRVEHASVSTPWNPASSHVEVADGRLGVHASCATEPSDPCATDLRVFVPAEVSALVSVAFGDILVSGVHGDLVAQSGGGDIVLQAIVGAVETETLLGDVSLVGVDGPVEAVADDGDIVGLDLVSDRLVAWALGGDVALELLEKGDVDARTDTGDVVLRVPAGAYHLDLSAEGGEVEVDGVTRDRNAALLHAFTRSGDIHIVGE